MKYREAEAGLCRRSRGRGSGDFYQQGLYKQGWALFKQNLNDESLPVFARLLDLKLRDARAAARLPPARDAWPAPIARSSTTRCA